MMKKIINVIFIFIGIVAIIGIKVMDFSAWITFFLEAFTISLIIFILAGGLTRRESAGK